MGMLILFIMHQQILKMALQQFWACITHHHETEPQIKFDMVEVLCELLHQKSCLPLLLLFVLGDLHFIAFLMIFSTFVWRKNS